MTENHLGFPECCRASLGFAFLSHSQAALGACGRGQPRGRCGRRHSSKDMGVGRKYPFQAAELKPMLLGPKAISTPLHSHLVAPLKPSSNKLQKLQSENCWFTLEEACPYKAVASGPL